MLETFRYETGRDRRGTVVFVALVAVYTAFVLALFPSIETAGVDLDQVVEAYPETVRQAMGVQSMSTVEGFLATQIYTFVWVLLLGLYFAYRTAGLVADDIERGRLDLLLSLPVSRSQLLLEKFASVLVPILALNVGVGGVVYATAAAIGESIDPFALAMAHLLSLPYLLTCAAVGLLLSVSVDRASVARRGAIGIVFALPPRVDRGEHRRVRTAAVRQPHALLRADRNPPRGDVRRGGRADSAGRDDGARARGTISLHTS